MIDRLQLLFHKWPASTWPPQGERIIPLSSSFHRPLQRGFEMLTNELKVGQVPATCIYFLINCMAGTCSWGHRKVKRMLAFSWGWYEIRGPSSSARWGRTGFVPLLDLFHSAPLGIFSFLHVPTASSKALLQARTFASVLPSIMTYLPYVTFLWGPALCPDKLILMMCSWQTLAPLR